MARNGRLSDGAAAPVAEHAAILVEDGRSVRIADAGEPTDGAPSIDLDGRTVLPGLIDAHAHVGGGFAKPEPLHGAEPIREGTVGHVLGAELREVLRMGITTVRDVGSIGDSVV